MEINELTDEERLAMVGLMKAVIQADKAYSQDESIALRKVALAVGEQLFNDTVSRAREVFKTLGDIKEYSLKVERQPAREAIFSVLTDLAESDEVIEEEKALLTWLSSKWEVSYKGA